MSTTQRLTQFCESLDERGVTSRRVDADSVETAVRDAIDGPAIGAPLDIDALDLESLGVDCAPSADAVREATTGVTGVAFGVAAHGTVVVKSTADGDEPFSLYPEKHVAVVRASDIVPDLAAAIDELGPYLRERRSAVLTTGASATGDMGALVEGVHGPREVHVIIVEDNE